MDEILQCTICYNSFDESNHLPQQLPCQHIFCTLCLKSLVKNDVNSKKKSIECPICRNIVKVDNLENIPKARLVIQLIELSKSNQKNSTISKSTANSFLEAKSNVVNTEQAQMLKNNSFDTKPNQQKNIESNFCFICNKTFQINEKKVTIFDNFIIHQKCFSCNLCQREINGNSYHQNDKAFILCSDCFKASQKKCKFCSKIIDGKYLTADNENYYHSECFKCDNCKRQISSSYTQYKNKRYHFECFKCSSCSKNIDRNEKFYTSLLFDILCKNCNLRYFGTMCKECKKYIEDSSIVFKNDSYHKNCLKCSKCKRSIEANQTIFTDENDRKTCSNCYFIKFDNLKCSKCNCNIFSKINQDQNLKYFIAFDQVFHEKCFLCFNCKQNLANKTIFKNENGIVCEKCENHEIVRF